jgi:hypothetical protein
MSGTTNKILADRLLKEGKITEKQAERLCKSLAEWDYIPGITSPGQTKTNKAGEGENAFVLDCAGINPSMGLYAQDLYLVSKLTGEQKIKYDQLKKAGRNVQGALKKIGITPYAGG